MKPKWIFLITGLLLVAGDIACVAYYMSVNNPSLVMWSEIVILLGILYTVISIVLVWYKGRIHSTTHVPGRTAIFQDICGIGLLFFITIMNAIDKFMVFIQNPQLFPDGLLWGTNLSILAIGFIFYSINDLLGWRATCRSMESSQETPSPDGGSGSDDQVKLSKKNSTSFREPSWMIFLASRCLECFRN